MLLASLVVTTGESETAKRITVTYLCCLAHGGATPRHLVRTVVPGIAEVHDTAARVISEAQHGVTHDMYEHRPAGIDLALKSSKVKPLFGSEACPCIT